MNYSNNFDKLSTPMMICSSDWKIVYKNRACKKFLPVPKCSNYISKYFFGDRTGFFPNKDDGIERIELDIKGSFKSAICFEYFGYAVILFPVLLDYEVFSYENKMFSNSDSAEILRSMISALNDETIQNEDRYHRLETVKRYVYGALENSLAYSMVWTKEGSLYPVHKLYRLIKDKILSVVMKAGYRVQIDIEGLEEIGELFAMNPATTSLVFSNMLLFCLSVSKNKTCFAEASVLGDRIRNKVYFSLPSNAFGGQTNSVEDFMYGKPAEYLNVLPFECMCDEFGWKVEYRNETDGAFNTCLCFDMEMEKIEGFSSEDMFSKSKNYEQTVFSLIDRIFSVL